MKNLVIQYKKTQYNLIPLHDEQLNGRVAGWNSEIVRANFNKTIERILDEEVKQNIIKEIDERLD